MPGGPAGTNGKFAQIDPLFSFQIDPPFSLQTDPPFSL